MKIIGLLICLSAIDASSAFASPNIGEHAAYDCTSEIPGQNSMPYTLDKKIVDHHNTPDEYKVVTTYVINGISTVSEEWQNALTLPSDITMDRVLAQCLAPRTYSVPAGTFLGCSQPIQPDYAGKTIDGGNYIFGKVPFYLLGLRKVENPGDPQSRVEKCELSAMEAGH